MVAALPAYLYFATVGVLLAAIDATTRKLPDRLTLPSYPVLAILFGVAAAVSGHWAAAARAAMASALLLLIFVLATALFGMGLGDAKLAGLVALALGFQPRSTDEIPG
jgi:leader peptidase (prepilin peptidase)/N-methyltransferase